MAVDMAFAWIVQHLKQETNLLSSVDMVNDIRPGLHWLVGKRTIEQSDRMRGDPQTVGFPPKMMKVKTFRSSSL